MAEQVLHTVHVVWHQLHNGGYTTVTGATTYNTHTIEADRDIDIQFIGNDVGTVLIEGGHSDIVVAGRIDNATGTTSINTTGSIKTTLGQIGGKVISLTGAGGVGSAYEYVALDLAGEESGAHIDASATGGAVFLEELTGAMIIGTVSAGGNRDAGGQGRRRHDARKFVFVDHWWQDRPALRVRQYRGGLSNKIRVNSGDRPTHLFTAQAVSGDVHLEETSGDLRIFEIKASSTVSVNVASGRILDANTNEVRDERAIEELQAGVWGDLALTDTDGGATQKINDTISSLESANPA